MKFEGWINLPNQKEKMGLEEDEKKMAHDKEDQYHLLAL
jgi:hypothetical protein